VKEVESIELFHDSLSKFGAVPTTGYHRPVKILWPVVAGWYHAALLAALAWVAAWRPGWAPVVAVAALAVHGLVHRTRAAEPWTSLLVVASAATFLFSGGWDLALGWLLLASLVAAVARALPRPDGSRPDAADFLAIGGWGVVFALAPRLIAFENGGWLAPALLILAAQRIARIPGLRSSLIQPGPPSREIRGTLSLSRIVVSGVDKLPRSVPLDLELRAGDSLAILYDSPEDAANLADVLTGRRAPHSGKIMVDGAPLDVGAGLAAVVAPGEPFIPGDLVTNLGALADRPLERSAVTAIREACSLSEVAEALGDRSLDREGSPLVPFHRLMVLAARVIPSSYHLVVVVDPMPWVNAVRGELWRSAVVRASVGRTAIWLTPDRNLAARAGQVVEYRQGALRRADSPANDE
jgi:putative ABC transport system ATP-binding protein